MGIPFTEVIGMVAQRGTTVNVRAQRCGFLLKKGCWRPRRRLRDCPTPPAQKLAHGRGDGREWKVCPAGLTRRTKGRLSPPRRTENRERRTERPYGATKGSLCIQSGISLPVLYVLYVLYVLPRRLSRRCKRNRSLCRLK